MSLFFSAVPLNWLNTMTQFKTKKDEGMAASLGLYAYPALMAADILLYNSGCVPVGEDQALHLEFARHMADRMNALCGKDTFRRPEAYKAPYTTEYRVMDLMNGSKKMSKSTGTIEGTLYMDDSEEAIRRKIMNARFDRESPEVRLVFHILECRSSLTRRSGPRSRTW